MINQKFGFAVNWQKQNLKPGNVVLIKSDQMWFLFNLREM